MIQYSLVSPGFLAFKSWSGVYTAAVAAQLGTLRTRLIAHLSLYCSGPDALTEVKGALAVALYAYVVLGQTIVDKRLIAFTT